MSTSPKSSSDKHQEIGADAQAIIDKVANKTLRNIFSGIVRFKQRLQFTGWLQYLLPVIPIAILLLIAGFFALVGLLQITKVLFYIAIFIFAWFLFDLLTSKFKLRLPEHRPPRNDQLDLFDLMRTRRSCRSFQTQSLSAEDQAALMESVDRHSRAPKLGTAPVRFEYISAPLTVWPTVNGHEFLVAIAPKKYDRLAVMDVGRSLQKIVMDATRMGLGTCWIGPGADHNSIIRNLGDRFDPDQDHIICVCAVGYKSHYIPMFIRLFNLQFNRRQPLTALFFADAQMQQPLNVNSPPFDQFGRTFEICQWAPSSYNGQTTRCIAITESTGNGARRATRFDFYAATKSRYYAAVASGIWLANWELGCQALGIKGHFERLAPADRGIETPNEIPPVPHYDMSWIMDAAS